MKKDKEITQVVYRRHKDGDIIALFPYLISNHTLCLSYMHVGQHGDADYHHCIENTSPAEEEEYMPLHRELESLGYNLEVIQRANGRKMAQAIEKARNTYIVVPSKKQ